MLVAYASDGARKRAYLEPVAVGNALRDMLLYLTPAFYVNVPLEATPRTAYDAVSRLLASVVGCLPTRDCQSTPRAGTLLE